MVSPASGDDPGAGVEPDTTGGLPQAGVGGPPPRPRLAAPATPLPGKADLVSDFKKAWEAGDIGALVGLLDPGATEAADGGGLVTAAPRPVEGAEQIARILRRDHRQGT